MSNGNGGGDLRRFYIVFAVVAAVGVAAVGYTMASGAMNAAVTVPVELEGTEDLRYLNELATPVMVGDEDAPATIIVFGDYLCTHCAEFSLRHRPLVEEALVATGRARLLFYDFPLNPEQGTFLEARAARCAGDQGRFWDYHDTLYRNQRSFAMAPDQLRWLQDTGEQMGLDVREFRGCLNSDRHAEAVTANLELARALGLPGTPAILVGSGQGMSRRLNSYAFETIQEAVDVVLAGSSGS
jgi:protein-disulfide isomerase